MARTLVVDQQDAPRVLNVSGDSDTKDSPRVLDTSAPTRVLNVSSQPRTINASSDSGPTLPEKVVKASFDTYHAGKELNLLSPASIIDAGKRVFRNPAGALSFLVGAENQVTDAKSAALGNLLRDNKLPGQNFPVARGAGAAGFDLASTMGFGLTGLMTALGGKIPFPGAKAPIPAEAGLPPLHEIPPASPPPTLGKLPLEADISATAGKIGKALNQIESVADTGTFQPREIRPELGKNMPASKNSFVNPEVVKQANELFVSMGREFRRIKQSIELGADDFTMENFKLAEERFKNAYATRQEAARTASESLAEFKKGLGEARDAADLLGMIKDVKPKLAALDKLFLQATRRIFPNLAYKYARNIGLSGMGDVPKNLGNPIKNLTNYLRVNLFTMGSWTLDALQNSISVGAKMPGYLLQDSYDMVRGQAPARTLGIMKAIKDEGVSAGRAVLNWDRSHLFGLPDEIEKALGGSVGGEKVGQMTNFKIGKFPVDYVVAAPVRFKGAVDALFSRIMTHADLVSSGIKEAAAQGLRGADKEAFIQNFIMNPPDAAKNSAITLGKQVRFDVPLSKLEEELSSSTGFQLLVDVYPRWAFQYARWIGRTLGANPEFFQKVVKGTATAHETMQYLSEAATGWGGIGLFAKAIYPHIDFNSMEFVNDKKERIRLSGRAPAPELAFITAVLKGDVDKSRKALGYTSLPFSKVVAGAPGGLIENWIEGMRQVGAGEVTSERFISEFQNMVNRSIPGQAVLSMFKTFMDPTVRKGIGAELPGVSKNLPPKINAGTGEPLKPRQDIFGVQMPAIGGVVFPGAKRILTPVENELLAHGVGLFRPRRTPVAEFESKDVPREMRQDFEVRAGHLLSSMVTEIMDRPEYKRATEEQKTMVLNAVKSASEERAKVEIAKERGIYLRGKEPNIRVKLLPEKFLEDAGIKTKGKFVRR